MLRFALKKSSIYNKQAFPINILKQQARLVNTAEGSSKSGYGKYILILVPLVAGGGVVAYAKYDNQFRKTLVDNVPGINPVLKVIFQEEGNAVSQVSKSIDNATKSVVDAKNSVSSFLGFSSDSKDEDTKKNSAKQSNDTVKQNITQSSASSKSPPIPAPPLDKPTSISTNDSSNKLVEPSPKITPAVTTTAKSSTDKISDIPSRVIKKAETFLIPTSITELESAVEVATNVAVKEYNNAINALKKYNEELTRVVDEAIEKYDNSVWNSLKSKTSARDRFVDLAEKAALDARDKLEKLEKCVSQVAKESPEIINKFEQRLKNVSNQLNKVKDELYEAKDSARLSEKYWRKVEVAHNYFINELEALCPNINLKDKKLNVTKDELDLILLHAFSHVLTYQKELQKLHSEGETRIRRALDALRSGGSDSEVIKSQVDIELAKMKETLNIENQKKLFHQQMLAEKKIRDHMKKLTEAHSDHLIDALEQKEIELRRIFNRELNEKISTEQSRYKTQIASMVGKLKGMDVALKERADADRLVRQSQSLWSACQALWAAVKSGEHPSVSWHHKLRPLVNEVAAVQRAAEGDELVELVLNGVPSEAKVRGVYPEDALRERFIHVEKLARRLALVPDKGAGLPIYLLSYIQSVFILTPSNVISKEELNNEPIDFNQFDTYEILNRARYWIDRGDLMQALKYMNLLKGASRRIANDWLIETRMLLETQQAANTLMAHAAASGLSFL